MEQGLAESSQVGKCAVFGGSEPTNLATKSYYGGHMSIKESINRLLHYLPNEIKFTLSSHL